MLTVFHVAGVHCSNKRILTEQLAHLVDAIYVERKWQAELLDEELLEGLVRGSLAAIEIVHGRLHDRFRESLLEAQHQVSLARRLGKVVCDRSPLDTACYRRAMMRVGWIAADCRECHMFESSLSAVALARTGICVAVASTDAVVEFERRGEHLDRPNEHASGYLAAAALEFESLYRALAAQCSSWQVVGTQEVSVLCEKFIELAARNR